jgi:hypothetical protein
MVKVAMVFLDLDLLQVRLNLSRGGTETRSTSMVNHNWLWNTWSRLRSWLCNELSIGMDASFTNDAIETACLDASLGAVIEIRLTQSIA